MWGPPVISWCVNPMNYTYKIKKSIINHGELGFMFTNLAIPNWGTTVVSNPCRVGVQF